MNFGDPAHPAVFKLSSVSQRLAIWIERFSYLFVNLYILFGQDRICYVTRFSILLQILTEYALDQKFRWLKKNFINALDLDIFLPYLDTAVFGHPDLYCRRVMHTLSYSSQGWLQLFCNCKISSHESFLSFWYFLFFLVLVRKINLKRAREIVRFLSSDVLFYALHLSLRI